MNSMRAVAIFPEILPENLIEFKAVATKVLANVQAQRNILRYDLFFTEDFKQCVVLEEFESPDGVIEHVKKNADLLNELTRLGGKIQGSIFPLSQDGEAIQSIKENWDSKFHSHFAGKI